VDEQFKNLQGVKIVDAQTVMRGTGNKVLRAAGAAIRPTVRN